MVYWWDNVYKNKMDRLSTIRRNKKRKKCHHDNGGEMFGPIQTNHNLKHTMVAHDLLHVDAQHIWV